MESMRNQLITCKLEADCCPQDDCDVCKIGKRWMEERINWVKKNIEAAKKWNRVIDSIVSKELQEFDKEFAQKAINREIPCYPKNWHCPGCGTRMYPAPTLANYCSICGQRILDQNYLEYEEEAEEE